MRTIALATFATLSLALAVSPLTVAGFDLAALAKDGNGGGHGGGNGGGHGGGNSGQGGGNGSQGHSADHNDGANNEASKSQGGIKGNSAKAMGTSRSMSVANAVTGPKQKDTASQTAGLNSLKRNYQAYLHTSDPRMTAVAAYAVAYARYELDHGTEPAPTDPALGDDALEKALAPQTRTGQVSPAELSKAKSILGVGDANGKIDQIRASLERSRPTE